ncbi:diguanylate cyclase [Burkholderia sp. R-70211]|nr:diguanylate cyclase [Burkholderia sp. R-70211]
MDKRFGIAIFIALIPVLTLSGWLLVYEALVYVRANEGLESFRSFRSALLAMEAVSAERGPTNGALGDELPIPAAHAVALQKARHTSDTRIAALIDTLRPAHCSTCMSDFSAMQKVQADLSAARSSVDQLAHRPRAQRGDPALWGAVNRMIGLIPEILPVVTTRMSGVVKGDTDALNCVFVARLTADLREQAGQLGSRFTGALAVHRQLIDDERLAIERTQGRIDQLRAMINTRVSGHPGLSQQLFARMNDQYFGDGLRYVSMVRALASQPDGANISTAEFAENYVPTMRAITDFRDGVLLLAEDEMLRHRRNALLVFLGTGIADALLLAMLMTVAVMFRRHVIGPFVQATHVIDAIARGDLTTDVPASFPREEINGMFNAIRVLKDNSAERVRLEQERLHLITELKTLAETDSLTGLLNRRAFESRACAMCVEAEHAGTQLAMVMFDVDHFKRINDTHGHAAGDDALRIVAELCRGNWRQSDLVARIGGEEFAVLTQVQTVAQAVDMAQRLRCEIEEAVVPVMAGGSCLMTASFGISFSSNGEGADVVSLLRRADRMLYAAKTSGRNRVVADGGTTASEGPAGCEEACAGGG